jgi:hypothetical protein
MPFGFTEAFLIRHVRNLATLEGGDSEQNVIRYAGIVLVARQEETEHNYPNTVMFMTPQVFGLVRQNLQTEHNRNFQCNVRIPYIVTWIGNGAYQIVKNAAGFYYSTNDQGECCHYGGVIQDNQSQVIDWKAEGLF